jgi:hypothetical protein
VRYADNPRVRGVPVRFRAARRGEESKRFAEFGHYKEISQIRTCNQVATPRKNRRRTKKRYARFASKQEVPISSISWPWAYMLRSRGTSTPKEGVCRKAKFNCTLPGSPYGRSLIEAPNRAVLANSWNGSEGVFDYLIGVAIMVVLVRVFPTGIFSLTASEFS